MMSFRETRPPIEDGKHDDKLLTPNTNKTISSIKRTSVMAFDDSPFVIPPSPLMKRLGCGTYVTVYRYKRTKVSGVGASPWAVKKAKHGHARPNIIERLQNEGEVLKTLKHPNIVLFKKLTTTPEGDVCLSMEVCGKGLDDIICKKKEDEDTCFSANDIMKVTWYIAKALKYLHTDKYLLHGDIKSGNILVKGQFEQVKLCDFGVSIVLKEDLSGPRYSEAQYIGSEPWHSMEIIRDNIITDKADVFAYGLVIWEMLALDVPHVALMNTDESDLDGSYTEKEESFSIPQCYYDALGTRPPLPDTTFTEKYDDAIATFICCTNENYEERPSASCIVDCLTGVVEEYGISPM